MIRFLLAFIFYVGLCSPVQAVGLTVTLYPSSADVREELTVQPENGKFSILLPQSVQQGSVRVSVVDAVVQSVGFSDALLVDSPRVAAAREAVEAARTALGEVNDLLNSLTARISLWQKPPVWLADAEGLTKADALVAASLPPLLAEKTKLEARRLKAQEELLRREAELTRISGRVSGSKAREANSVRSTDELTAQVASLSEKPLAKTLRVMLDYTLDNCGWESEYRLEAFTDKGMVKVSRLAAIQQRSGRDWQDATIRLATSRPAAEVNPQPVREWHLQPAGLQQRPLKAVAPSPMEDSAPMAARSIELYGPAKQEGAAFMTWELGKRNLNSGDDTVLLLDSQDWKADFYRLLRPGLERESWLMATVTPATPQILPLAGARLVVDNVSMGVSAFEFSGDKGEIALGVDPSVTGDMLLNSNQSGDQGIIAKSQTRVWDWRITVRNAHSTPVTVWVEDAEPQSANERIAVRVESSPQPKVEKHVLRWTFTVPGNGKTDITHKVSMSAPADMQVWTGR